MKCFCVLLTFLLLAPKIPAQLANAEGGSFYQSDDFAPLYLFTSGAGKVLRLHDGQMLEVGRQYVLRAVPDRGYFFTGWNKVNVFTFMETTTNPDGSPNPVVTSTVLSPVPISVKNSLMRFTMAPEEVLIDVPGDLTVTESVGWQANFVRSSRR